ncbi:MAG: hypothetical protein METHAR1v1_110005 [Methanothrix sp.]|nr:MAG: hypothetical protein METHAR1v1_110005 [Methanothrix sp.]
MIGMIIDDTIRVSRRDERIHINRPTIFPDQAGRKDDYDGSSIRFQRIHLLPPGQVENAPEPSDLDCSFCSTVASRDLLRPGMRSRLKIG